MGLDVTLINPTPIIKHRGSGIFIRENGQNVEISIEQWNERNPEQALPIVDEVDEYETFVAYSSHITHNLTEMARFAGLYTYLWRPDEEGILYAKDLIPYLEVGLSFLKAHPEECKEFNPTNGWGSYEPFVKFVEDYLESCKKYPDAEVEADR